MRIVSAASMSASVEQTIDAFGPSQSYGSFRNASVTSIVQKWSVSSGWALMPQKSRFHSSISSRIV
jgi:hypothetical protein